MTDVFTNRGGLSEKKSDKAQRAVKNFRRLQPTLSSYARVLTGDPKVRVEMSTSNGMTDGKKIYFRPPIALGDDTPHDRALCDKRDEHGLMKCPACAVREQVLIVIYHEIGHIAFGSFEETPENKERYLREVLRRMANQYDMARRAQHLATSSWSPHKDGNTYLQLATYVSPYLPIVVNALDDSRVNNSVMDARKGTRIMFEADTYRVMSEGVEQVDAATGETITVEHRDYPLNMQAAIGLYLKALGISIDGYLRPEVVEALNDKVITSIVRKMSTARSMAATFEIGLEVLFRMQQLGFFDPPEDMEQEQPDTGEDGESDDTGDEGESSGSPEEGDEERSEESSSSSSEGEGGEDSASSDGGSEDDGEDGVGDSDESESEDSGVSGVSGDSSDEADSDSETGESDAEAGDGTDLRNSEDDASSSGDESDPEVDHDASVQDSEHKAGNENSSTEGEVDDSAQDDSTAKPTEGSEDSDASDSGADDRGDSEGADGGTPEPRSGEDADASDESEGQDADAEPSEDGEAGGTDDGLASGDLGGESEDGPSSDERDVDHGEPEVALSNGSDGGDLAPEEPSSSDEDRSLDHDDNGTESETEPGVREDSSGDDGPIDSGADEGRGGVELKESSAFDDLPMGDPEDVEKTLHEFAHPEQRPNFAEETGPDGEKEMDRAIIQGLYFETPSRNVHGVREHHYGQPQYVDGYNMSEAWPELTNGMSDYYKQIGVTGDFESPESVLGPALLRMRVAFADNKRGHEYRHRKAGKIDAKVLGKRANFNDPRLFKRRVLPGKKDYFVLIGIDISGSTIGINLMLSKRAALAQAELCARMGIKFAVYAHTGNYHSPNLGRSGGLDMEIYHVKDPDEPWTPAVQERLTGLAPCTVNLDGHTIEFYRKILDARPETHKIMLYYTDGKMPAENHDEELEILQREIKICRRKGHVLLGVGIRTDSPIRHGLDTVQVDNDEDIVKVVKHLERRLLEL